MRDLLRHTSGFRDDGALNSIAGRSVTTSGTRAIFPSATMTGDLKLYTSIADVARFERNLNQPIVGGAGVITHMLSRRPTPFRTRTAFDSTCVVASTPSNEAGTMME